VQEEGAAPVDRLPVEIFDLRAIDQPARPPLADAARENLAHFAAACERQLLRDMCAPLSAVSGAKKGEIGSSNRVWSLADINARLQGSDPSTGTLEDVANEQEVLRANIASQLSDLRQFSGQASGVALSIEAFHQMARARSIFAAAVSGTNRLLDQVAESEALNPEGRPVASMPLGMDAPTGFSSATTMQDLREAVRDDQLPASVLVEYMAATEQLPEEQLELAKASAVYRQAQRLAEDGVLTDHELRQLGLATLGDAGKMFPLLKTEPAEGDPLAMIQIQEGGELTLAEAAQLLGVIPTSKTLARQVKAHAARLVKEAGGKNPRWARATGNRELLEFDAIGLDLPEIAYYREAGASRGGVMRHTWGLKTSVRVEGYGHAKIACCTSCAVLALSGKSGIFRWARRRIPYDDWCSGRPPPCPGPEAEGKKP
jgi:hypothetical protein